MNAVILTVGRLGERWQKDGVAEYLKRLSRYGNYAVAEVPDEPDGDSPALVEKAKISEGQRLLRQIKPNDFVVALCVDGEAYSSEGLARKTAAYAMNGRRTVFVIGGSNGLSEEVIARANERLSFSKLTFPHGLMRVVLLEQLYRAERINAGERYHK